MTTTNQFGIFARNISSGINTGTDAVRGFSDDKCRRVYRACVAVLPAEEVAFVRETFNPAQTVSLTDCTVAQAWVSRMLSSIETEFSTKTTIHGADNDEVIHDNRTAREVLLKVLAA